MTPNASLQTSIFLPVHEGQQTYTHDGIAAPLEEHARRLGVIGKPIRYHENQRLTLHKLLNEGSLLVIRNIQDLIRSPSEAEPILRQLLSKGIRIWCCELGSELAPNIQTIKACASAWRGLEADIARLHEVIDDDRRRAREREADLATNLTGRLLNVGIVAGVKTAIEKAYATPTQQVS